MKKPGRPGLFVRREQHADEGTRHHPAGISGVVGDRPQSHGESLPLRIGFVALHEGWARANALCTDIAKR
jgi:hypothetical protein